MHDILIGRHQSACVAHVPVVLGSFFGGKR